MFKDARKIRLLCIFLPKISTYEGDFDQTKCIPFLVKDEKLLEKCSEIWKKFSNVIKNEFDSKPVYNEKYLKSKIKSYNGKSTQISTIIKYQEKILNVFVISVILIKFIEKIKAILKCF